MNFTTSATEPAAIDSDLPYEVLNGQVVFPDPKPTYSPHPDSHSLMEACEVDIASEILFLRQFAKKHHLGKAVAEMQFLLDGDKNLERRANVAVVTYQRWPRDRGLPRTTTWNVVPELAVQVVSATYSAEKIIANIREYFQYGVRLVWVVYPSQELVYVYQSPVRLCVLAKAGELDGEDILPGFRLPVAALFGEEASL